MAKKKHGVIKSDFDPYRVIIAIGLVVVIEYFILTSLSSRLLPIDGRAGAQARLIIALGSAIPLLFASYFLVSTVMKKPK